MCPPIFPTLRQRPTGLCCRRIGVLIVVNNYHVPLDGPVGRPLPGEGRLIRENDGTIPRKRGDGCRQQVAGHVGGAHPEGVKVGRGGVRKKNRPIAVGDLLQC